MRAWLLCLRRWIMPPFCVSRGAACSHLLRLCTWLLPDWLGRGFWEFMFLTCTPKRAAREGLVGLTAWRNWLSSWWAQVRLFSGRAVSSLVPRRLPLPQWPQGLA